MNRKFYYKGSNKCVVIDHEGRKKIRSNITSPKDIFELENYLEVLDKLEKEDSEELKKVKKLLNKDLLTTISSTLLLFIVYIVMFKLVNIASIVWLFIGLTMIPCVMGILPTLSNILDGYLKKISLSDNIDIIQELKAECLAKKDSIDQSKVIDLTEYRESLKEKVVELESEEEIKHNINNIMVQCLDEPLVRKRIK